MQADDTLAVGAFHEAKAGNAGPELVLEAEKQARDACKRYLDERWDVEAVYAITSFGTKARAWKYIGTGETLDPLFGAKVEGDRKEYIDLDYSDAYPLLRGSFAMMKNVRPSE